MTFPQAILAVLIGNAIAAGALYCVWLSKRDGNSPKGIALALSLCVVIGLISYASRQ